VGVYGATLPPPSAGRAARAAMSRGRASEHQPSVAEAA
jgi:hypothetical protein